MPSAEPSPGFDGEVVSVRMYKISVNTMKGNVAIPVETHTEIINHLLASRGSISVERLFVCLHVLRAILHISIGKTIEDIIASGNQAR